MSDTSNLRTFKCKDAGSYSHLQADSTSPALTSFATSRIRQVGNITSSNAMSSSEMVVPMDGRIASSPYSNISSTRRSSKSKEVGEGRQETNDSRYNQRRSSVIRINTRNMEDDSVFLSDVSNGVQRGQTSTSAAEVGNNFDSRYPPLSDSEYCGSKVTKLQSTTGSTSVINHSTLSPPTMTSFQALQPISSFSGSNNMNNMTRLEKSANTSIYGQEHLGVRQSSNVYLSPSSPGITQSDTLPYPNNPYTQYTIQSRSPSAPSNTKSFNDSVDDRSSYKSKQVSRVSFAVDDPSKQLLDQNQTEPTQKQKDLGMVEGKIRKEREQWPRVAQQNKALCCVIIILIMLLFACIGLLVHVLLSKPEQEEKVQSTYKSVLHQQKANDPIMTGTTLPELPKKESCDDDKCIAIAGSIFARMNTSADPCEDFYEYACGGWIASKKVLPIQGRYGVRTQIKETNDKALHELLSGIKEPPPNVTEAERKAMTFYQSCLNENAIEGAGNTPLLELLDALGGWPAPEILNLDKSKLLNLLYQAHGVVRVNILFSTEIAEDSWNFKKNILQIGEKALFTLEERTFYFNQIKFENSLKKAISTTLNLLEAPNNQQVVNDIFAFEKKLAEISSAVDPFQPFTYNQKFTIAQLSKLCPEIEWFRLIRRMIPSAENLQTEVQITGSDENYFRNLSRLLRTSKPKAIYDYMLWRIAFSQFNRLSLPFRQVTFELEYVIYGWTSTVQRWKLCLSYVKKEFTKAVGILFARDHFSAKSKYKLESMGRLLKATLKRRLNKLAWLDGLTKGELKKQLTRTEIEVGYEAKYWENPDMLNRIYDFPVHGLTFFRNYQESVKFAFKRNARRLVRKGDMNTWKIDYYDMNGYHSVYKDRITLPAGLLQSPYYDPKVPATINFGAAGSIIGHELIHVIDMFASKAWFANATEERWFSEKVTRKYAFIQSCVNEQYQKLDPQMDVTYSLYENMADIAGLQLAYYAYQHFEPRKKIIILPGYSNEKAFFISYAQGWCAKHSPASYKLMINTEYHAPERSRVVGSVSQFEEFSKVFQCPSGSAMHPKKKCSVW